MSTNIRTPARTVSLQASDGFDPNADEWRFSGIAIGNNDILHMSDGQPVLFEPDELRRAAESMAGEKLTVDHPVDANGEPAYPPPVDGTIGTVEKAGYVAGKGVGYEAVTHDPDVARGIAAGTYEVSVHPRFALGDTDPETDVPKAESVDFGDLSVVSMGDSDSQTVRVGPNRELAAWANGHNVADELTAAATEIHKPTFSGTTTANWDKPSLEDFTNEPWDDLSSDEQSSIADNFFVSVSGFSSPENFGDLKLPVVEPDDDLNYNGLVAADSYVGRTDGISDEQESQIETWIDSLKQEHFDTSEESTASLWQRLGSRLGVATDRSELVADGSGDEQPADESAESDSDDDTETMTDDETESDPDDEQNPDERTLGDVTISDLTDALREEGFVTESTIEEQGFITESEAEELAANQREQQTRDELVATITENTDKGEEALAEWPLDALEDKAQSLTSPAQLPGGGGRHTETVASTHPDGDVDLDAVGTGVAE